MRTLTRSAALSGLVGLLLAGCSSKPASPSMQLAPQVWPAPPEAARVEFVASAGRPAELGAQVRGFTRFANWLTGAVKGNEPFVKPFAVAVDEQGNLLVTDTGANAVGWLDVAGRRWHRWEKIGGQKFRAPVSIAKRGPVIYVADSEAGEVVAFDVEGNLKFRMREGLMRPSGLALRGEELLVADASVHAVKVFDLDGRLRGQFGSRGAGEGQLNFPTHLSTDAAGRVYVTDSMNCRVQVFDAQGKFLRSFGAAGDSPGHFGRPKGLAVDAQGNVLVLDAMFDALQFFNPEGRLLLSLGQTGEGAGEFWLPTGITVAPDGRVYVADSYNRRVQVFRLLNPTP
jgi:DNA-binding beta-propeller fold protein YncE